MLRPSIYLIVGWLLIALVGGLADVLRLTVMLPATSAVVLTHVAFSRGTTTASGLAVAVALGYLEDLHQGAPVGTLSLAYGLAYVAADWSSARLHVSSWFTRALASAAVVVVVDVLTWLVLWAMADKLAVRREALATALWDSRFHALATLLVAPVVWGLIERTFAALRIEERSPQAANWGGK